MSGHMYRYVYIFCNIYIHIHIHDYSDRLFVLRTISHRFLSIFPLHLTIFHLFFSLPLSIFIFLFFTSPPSFEKQRYQIFPPPFLQPPLITHTTTA